MVAFWSCPFQWVIEPIGMIDKFGRGFALETKYAAVRMIEVGIETNHLAIGYGGNSRAVRGTQSAKPAHGMGGLSGINHRTSNYSPNDSLSTRVLTSTEITLTKNFSHERSYFAPHALFVVKFRLLFLRDLRAFVVNNDKLFSSNNQLRAKTVPPPDAAE
jgi:hypothetical protein